jgi:hypothetical protein
METLRQLLDEAEIRIRTIAGLTCVNQPDVGQTIDEVLDGFANLRGALCIVDEASEGQPFAATVREPEQNIDGLLDTTRYAIDAEQRAARSDEEPS